MAKRYIALYMCIAVLITLISCPFVFWYMGGRTIPFGYYDPNTQRPKPGTPMMYFRGLSLPTPDGFHTFFKRYYKIVQKDNDTGLTFTVEYKEDGYNDFVILYQNKKIAGKGLCMIRMKPFNQMVHDIHDVKYATYYDPDGNLVSKIENGTGVQIFYYPDGTKQLELELENYRRKSLKMWFENGILKQD